MLAQAVEGLGADIVLNAAGILERGFLADSHPDKDLRQAVMPSVGLLRDQASFGGEGDAFFLVQFPLALARAAFDLLADRWAGELHVAGNIDSTHGAFSFLEDENGFQVHFSRFLEVHALFSLRVSNRCIDFSMDHA